MSLSILSVDHDTERTKRLREATLAFQRDSSLTVVSDLETAFARLQKDAFDIVTIAPEFACEETRDFIPDARETEGGDDSAFVLIVEAENRGLLMTWDPDDCAVMPMLSHQISGHESLSRVFFSVQELDDTTVPGGRVGSFGIRIGPKTP